MAGSESTVSDRADYDVIVVGAGLGGMYGVHRFREQGLSVLGLEGAKDVGGVWYHNRYPGARVDIDSIDYCYYFSPELYREWRWSERYATQPELLRYLDHVAERFEIRKQFLFETWLTGAQWRPASARYEVTTSSGRSFSCRFLVMATGCLSRARKPDFKGLDSFKGEWLQTSHWPDRPVALEGKRIGIIGTGSTGVQAVPELAKVAKHLHVFQRTPNYSVPARNGPMDEATWTATCADVAKSREFLFTQPSASHKVRGGRPASDFTHEEQQAMLERQWAFGGQGMNTVFTDQGVNQAANDIVSNFVRSKIRSIVKDPAVAEKLCPFDHPIGTRRLILDTDYYATYNRPNVTLVDVRADPIAEITPTGIRTRGRQVDLDVIVFALGFHAFTGHIEGANIRNERSQTPTGRWKRGPRTRLGLMTAGFPNFFFLTGPGSPSVLANMTLGNEFHVDWIADCIAHMDARGLATVEPTEEGEEAWTRHVAEVASTVLRLKVKNYMVHANDDGSGVFIPYVGGMARYVEQARAAVANGYEGFRFGESGNGRLRPGERAGGSARASA